MNLGKNKLAQVSRKAAEDSRTPGRYREALGQTASARSWSAAVLSRFHAYTLLLACLLPGGCASDHNTRSSTQVAAAIDINGGSVDALRVAREKPVVLIFVRTDCPVSNRYAPEIERLYHDYSLHGIAFWLVYPDPDTSTREITEHAREYRLHVPSLRDPKHTLVRATGASVTPEVVVLVPLSATPVYRGRIDDRMADLGKERPEARERDLENVLQAVVSGKAVEPRTTKAIGCYISER